MRFITPLVLAYVAAGEGTYSGLTLTSNNSEECNQCVTVEGTGANDITTCLAKVPSTCLYSVTYNGPTDANPTACPSALGADLTPIWPSISSARVESMSGSLKLTLDVTPKDCTYNVLSSSNAKDVCGTSGVQAEKTITEPTIDLSGFKDPYYNLVSTSGDCGKSTSTATVEKFVMTLTVTGTLGDADTESTNEAEAPADDTSGAVPLMSLSAAVGVLTAIHAA